jgi:selenium metabolism protein YedF
MEEYLVDARGEVCPRPLILTRRALSACKPGQPVRILIDNEISKNNVTRFLADNGFPLQCTEHDGLYELALFGAASAVLPCPDAPFYCAPVSTTVAGHAVVISGNRMGTGDDALGELLLKAFVNTIAEVKPLPGVIVLYNSGVHMATDDSPVVESLRTLQNSGVKILVCGTCVNFYDLGDRIHVGVISNMYTILEMITSASLVIKP